MRYSPLGPMTARISPGRTWPEMSDRILCFPTELQMFSNASSTGRCFPTELNWAGSRAVLQDRISRSVGGCLYLHDSRGHYWTLLD